MSRRFRIVAVGWGALMRHAAALMAERLPQVEIVGVAVRDPAERDDLPPGARVLNGPEDLPAGFADLVIEAAKADAVEPWGLAALARAGGFAPLSISAFTTDGVLARLVAVAEQHGTHLLIPSGAIGAVDALRAASFAGLDSVRHEIVKPLAAWRGTEAEALIDPGAQGPVRFLTVSAREAARRFPLNANVAALVALCGIGLDATEVTLTADPAATCNSHIITATGAFGRFSIRLDNKPVPDNPKSSALTALSIVRLVEAQSAAVRW